MGPELASAAHAARVGLAQAAARQVERMCGPAKAAPLHQRARDLAAGIEPDLGDGPGRGLSKAIGRVLAAQGFRPRST